MKKATLKAGTVTNQSLLNDYNELIQSNFNELLTPRSLTLAELTALQVNPLPVGQQYYVTDKDWLLYADSPTVLKPVKGSLHIFNGETLPTGIEPDVLFIDTGIVDWDISAATGTPFEVVFIHNYVPFSIDLNVSNGADGLYDFNAFNTVFFLTEDDGYVNGDNVKILRRVPEQFYPLINNTIVATGNGGVENYFRAILEFHRSEFSVPIPVPHIVSAETISTDTLQVITTDIMKDGFYDPDATIYINGIAQLTTIAILNNEFFISLADSPLFTFGDVITVSIASGNIKNIWGGSLEEVVDYPVVNNVLQA